MTREKKPSRLFHKITDSPRGLDNANQTEVDAIQPERRY